MAKSADYYQTHREAMCANQRAYYYRKQVNDPEYKAWRKEYMREYMREYSRKRRSIQKENKILMAILA